MAEWNITIVFDADYEKNTGYEGIAIEETEPDCR